MSPVDQDRVERLFGVERIQLHEQALQPIVAARTRSAALDAKAVALAHDVDIGQMGDAPCAPIFYRV
jgi:hypothetical protein